MNIISKDIREAVKNAVETGTSFSKQNTCVTREGNIVTVYLHGNHIFDYNVETRTSNWSDCGWPTKTTVARLNDCFAGIGSTIKIHRKKTDSGYFTGDDRYVFWETYEVK